MFPVSHAVKRLRKQYRNVLTHMRVPKPRLRGSARGLHLTHLPCQLEPLEPRLLLSGTLPTFNTDIPGQWVLTPGARGLTIGVDGDDTDGDPLTISASSNNALIHVSVPYDQTIAPILAVLHFTAGDGVTPIGDITVQLLQGHANESLAAVQRFITLATTGYDAGGAVDPTADPFYTNVLVHRVIDDFMIQTGDAELGTGTGGSPLGKFNDTFDPALGFQGIGALAMANSGPNTNDCQFFITEDPTTWLDGQHMIFGQVISGWDVLQQISEVRVDANDRPRSDILLAGIDILNSSQDGSLEFTADAGFTGSADVTITLTDDDGNTVQKVITVTAASGLGARPTVDLPVSQTTVHPGESTQITATLADDLGASIKSWIEVDVPGLVGSGVAYDAGTNEVSIDIPSDFDVPSFTVTVYAEEAGDYANLTASTASFFVNVAGDQPTISVPALLDLVPGQSRQFTPTLTDDSPRRILLSARSADPDVTVSLDATTNKVTVGAAAGASGLYAVTLSAIESGFNSDLAPTTKTLWVAVQNAGDPPAVGMIDLSDAGPTMGTALENNILYVARGEAGLWVYDVSDPSAPVLKDSLNLGGEAWDVQIQHTQRAGQNAIIAYVPMIYDGSAVVDVTDPANIQQIDQLGTGSAAVSLCVMGNRLLQSDWTYGLVVWDITDPDNIQWQQTVQQVIPASGGYGAYDLGYTVACDVQGDKAYVADANGILFIITFTSPTTYSVNSYYVTDGRPWDVAVQDGVAYIQDEFQGLIALDVSNPAAPELVSSAAIPEMDWSHLAVSGTLAVLSTPTGYQFVDISDPAHMSVAYDFYAPTRGGQASFDGTMLALPLEQAAGVLMVDVGPQAENVVNFPDPLLEQAVRSAIGKPTGDILASDLGSLTVLNVSGLGIVDLTGLEYCTSLQTLDLSGNQIGDLSPLVANLGLDTGDQVNLVGNPLSPTARTVQMAALLARGVPVQYDPTLAYDLTGSYWFNGIGANVDTGSPYAFKGEGEATHDAWSDAGTDETGTAYTDSATIFSTAFTTDGWLFVDFADATWGGGSRLGLFVAANEEFMASPTRTPDEDNDLGDAFWLRKPVALVEADVVGEYSFFNHWLEFSSPSAGSEYGTVTLLANHTFAAVTDDSDGEHAVLSGTWTLDAATSTVQVIIDGLGTKALQVGAGGLLACFDTDPADDGSLGYVLMAKRGPGHTVAALAGHYLYQEFTTDMTAFPDTYWGTIDVSDDGTFVVSIADSQGVETHSGTITVAPDGIAQLSIISLGYTYSGQITLSGDTMILSMLGQDGQVGMAVAVRAGVLVPAQVVGRHAFFNNSDLDGNNAAANDSDDNAIATDKQPLLPGGTAGPSNRTSYSLGINGIMVDIDSLPDPAGLTLAKIGNYFTFKVSDDNNPGSWNAAPSPIEVLVREGAGDEYSDRVTIIWADGAIQKEWLQVTVLSGQHGGHAGLVEDDVFYFGNLPGDANGDGTVDAADYIVLKRAFGSSTGGPGVSADFNGNGMVDHGDLMTLQGSFGQSINVAFAAPALPARAASVELPATGAVQDIVMMEPAVAVTGPEPSVPPVDEPAPAAVAMTELSLELPAESGTLQATAGVLDALANSRPTILSSTPLGTPPPYAEPPARFASQLGPLLTIPSPLLSAGRACRIVADVLQLAAPWWSGNSAGQETPDEPWMTRLAQDIAAKPREDWFDLVNLDILVAGR